MRTKILFFILIITLILGLQLLNDALINDLETRNEILSQRLSNEQADNDNLINRLEEARKYNKFLDAANKIGSIPYSKENNCYEHSKQLQKILEENGIGSSIFITPTRNHAYIGVWIEANTGNFISPNKYEVGELRDSKLNVVCNNDKIIN